jgi:hypothetical protein
MYSCIGDTRSYSTDARTSGIKLFENFAVARTSELFDSKISLETEPQPKRSIKRMIFK